MLDLLAGSEVGVLFITSALGLGLGRIRVRGTSIGVAGVLFVGLLLGHLGVSVPSAALPLGTVLFVAAVGLSAGAGFRVVVRRLGKGLIVVSATTITIGFLFTLALARVLDLSAGLAAGMMAGALTSTPGLGAAIEAAAGDPMVGVGYAVAYPIGVIGVIAGVNVVSRLAPAAAHETTDVNAPKEATHAASPSGSALSLTLIASLGIIVGMVPIPIPWVGTINLGTAGGPLLVAILLGHLGAVGPVRADFSRSSLVLIRDLGAVFILAAVGTATGGRFINLVSQHGPGLLLGGLTVTVASILTAVFTARMLLPADAAGLLGTVSGAMTSTPGLTASIDAIGSDRPGLAYAAVYPAAVVLNCVACRIMVVLLAR